MTGLNLQHYLPELQIIWNALVRQDLLPEKADVIIVGGCRDAGLAERAAELYHAGIANLIVITGYQPTYMEMTEAEFLAGECINRGVPKEAIILEKEAHNTGENIRFAAKILDDTNTTVTSAILIHKPYMSLRFLATAEAQWPQPQPHFYATCQSISFEDYYRLHGIDDTAWKMLGDLKRMSDYVERGYQTPQAISEIAYRAYQSITVAGFITR